jgi:hypothetical protein
VHVDEVHGIALWVVDDVVGVEVTMNADAARRRQTWLGFCDEVEELRQRARANPNTRDPLTPKSFEVGMHGVKLRQPGSDLMNIIDRGDGMFVPRSLTLNIPGLMLELAPKRSIPAIFQDAFFVERGGLVSYAANTFEVGRQAARLADRILKGARPADIPVEQPTKFNLVINTHTARALGLTIPPSLLVRVDRVIE